jgi:septum formation protein
MMNQRLILASASPRRKELLGLLRIPFEVIPSEAHEDDRREMEPQALAHWLAFEKARDVWRREGGPGTLVLGADTIVVAEDGGRVVVLNKPEDAEDARRMLRMLSGREHRVITGLALLLGVSGETFRTERAAVETTVVFRTLTDAMIDAYLATGEPFDKAGAYGIQGFASAFVTELRGDYFNVVGLPVSTVAAMLERAGVPWWEGNPAAG